MEIDQCNLKYSVFLSPPHPSTCPPKALRSFCHSKVAWTNFFSETIALLACSRLRDSGEEMNAGRTWKKNRASFYPQFSRDFFHVPPYFKFLPHHLGAWNKLQHYMLDVSSCCLPVGGRAVTGLFVGRLVGLPLQYIKFACCISRGLMPRVFPSFVLPSLRVIVVRPLPKAVEW